MKAVEVSYVSIYNGVHMALERAGQSPDKESIPGDGGQEGRFLKAFDAYADSLFRHAALRLSDRERAIEIVQDTFAKVWRYLREGHEVSSFRSFLYKVLNNLVIDEYRRRKEASLDAILEAEGVDEGMFPELREEPLEDFINAFDAQQLLGVLHELPDMYREPIILRFIDGLTPKEIAEVSGESENVISVRIHRGIKAIRKKIDAQQKMFENKDL